MAEKVQGGEKRLIFIVVPQMRTKMKEKCKQGKKERKA